MNAELQAITLGQLATIIHRCPEREILLDFARPADPLFVALLGPVLLGFIGFLPRSTLSDTAYVWVHLADDHLGHSMSVIRLARRYMTTFHTRYTTLVGHCFEPHSRRWLATLGATFGPDNTFIIKAHHG